MTQGDWIKLLAFPFAISGGQILFKQVANSVQGGFGMKWMLAVALHPMMWLAILLYAGATILWVNILQSLPLSRAYPVMALAFVLVPIAGVLFFGEKIDARYVMGAVLITSGILLASHT